MLRFLPLEQASLAAVFVYTMATLVALHITVILLLPYQQSLTVAELHILIPIISALSSYMFLTATQKWHACHLYFLL